MVLFGAAFAAGKASGGGDSGEESSGDSASKPKAAEKVTAPERGLGGCDEPHRDRCGT